MTKRWKVTLWWVAILRGEREGCRNICSCLMLLNWCLFQQISISRTRNFWLKISAKRCGLYTSFYGMPSDIIRQLNPFTPKIKISGLSTVPFSLFSIWEFVFRYIKLYPLTLYTLTSVYIFSILFSIHFLWCWQGEFVKQSRASLVGDHFFYSHDLNVCFDCDTDGRN